MRREAVRISFIDFITVILRFDVIFVQPALAHIRYKTLPNACGSRIHYVGRRIPSVKIANHRYKFCVWRPHRKMNAAAPVACGQVSPELVVGAVKSTFAEEVQIEFAQGRLQNPSGF